MDAAWDMLATLLARGGWVMWPLLAISLLSVTLCLERAWFWMHTRRFSRRMNWIDLVAALRAGNRERVEGMLGRNRSIYARVIRALLKGGASESIAIEVIESQRPRFERFMMSLSTIITAAPLLGILGTVTGIIGSFELLGEARLVTDPREVSGGIAEALITTAVGLVIALATLFPYMIFRAQVERALGQMETLIAAAREGLGGSPDTAERSSG